jgi:hypothetical protein
VTVGLRNWADTFLLDILTARRVPLEEIAFLRAP